MRRTARCVSSGSAGPSSPPRPAAARSNSISRTSSRAACSPGSSDRSSTRRSAVSWKPSSGAPTRFMPVRRRRSLSPRQSSSPPHRDLRIHTETSKVVRHRRVDQHQSTTVLFCLIPNRGDRSCGRPEPRKRFDLHGGPVRSRAEIFRSTGRAIPATRRQGSLASRAMEATMVWSQVYDPLGSPWLSTLVAALPVVVLLAGLGVFRLKAHTAALAGLAVALASAVFVFGMPAEMAGKTALFGAAFGLLPIGWIILNIIFLYKLTEKLGLFKVLQDSISGITDDRRLQLLLIAFCFGAFFEGAAGFGTPVAVTGAILIGLGFTPLAASGLSLIVNMAPVAYGALGSPVLALAAVTGLPLLDLSAMIGRQLPIFSVIVPFWLIVAFAGWRGTVQIWPAILIAGVSFAIPQFLMSNFHGPWLVDVVASLISMASLTLFLKVWQPETVWTSLDRDVEHAPSLGAAAVNDALPPRPRHTNAEIRRAWLPWIILSVLVFLWGLPQVKAFLDGVSV